MVILKPEGLNDQAYLDVKNGKVVGACQRKISNAALEVLQKRLSEVREGSGKKYKFRIVGYSEGSSQGISLAARILESGLGEVEDITSIGACGFVGVDVVEQPATPEVPVKQILGNVVVERFKSHPKFPRQDPNGKKIYHLRKGDKGDNIYVDSKLLSDKNQGGFEASLGREPIDKGADKVILLRWFTKYFKSKRADLEEGVPSQRIKALWTRNPDLDFLAERAVPIKIFAGYFDQLFPSIKAEETIDQLRQKGGNILLISSNVTREYPHLHPSAVAYVLELFAARKST